MIRIARGAEPAALVKNRARCLAKAEQALERGEKPDFVGYDVAREPLFRAQHGKCAYCEMPQQQAANPTEHFRPKAAVTPDPPSITAAGGYWWLAWDWHNLVFSCTTCNSPARKGNHFALRAGSTPLTPGQHPPGDEHPMFIDPGREDPLDHIVFVQRLPGQWVPLPRGGSRRGDYTIKRLRLDHPDLLTLYRDHVQHTVQPALQGIRDVLAGRNAQVITHAWSRCLRRLFHPRVRFHALSYDVLDASLAEARARWHLPLPRP